MRSSAFRELDDFIRNRMRMSHVYQPIMLRAIFRNGGNASTREIATALLAEDRSQIEYYERIVNQMPGRVLRSHGVVEKHGSEYRLSESFQDLDAEELGMLIEQCERRLDDYLEKRGLAPWQHRLKSKGAIPGSLRYDLIRRAKGRCEACGVSAEDRALEIDHIIPRNKGGSDEHSNLQVLCFLCNAQKRDRDVTNFAAVQASYEARDDGCVFCNRESSEGMPSNELATVVNDRYPVTQGHCLVLPRRHVADWFELHKPERNAMEELLLVAKERLCTADNSIRGFNIGVNVGDAAGQTVSHVHMHLIPRRCGDMTDPRGGVRGVIPEKQRY